MIHIIRGLWMLGLRCGPTVYRELIAEFDPSMNPGASGKWEVGLDTLKRIYDKIRSNDPSYTPPPGMPDDDGKGEYPEGSTSPVKPPMPDYTPSTSPNNPPDKNPPDKPYTPPPGMPNYDPSDPNQPKEPILPIDPSKSPFPSPYPWDKDLPPDPPVDPLVLDLDGDSIILVGRAVA